MPVHSHNKPNRTEIAKNNKSSMGEAASKSERAREFHEI